METIKPVKTRKRYYKAQFWFSIFTTGILISFIAIYEKYRSNIEMGPPFFITCLVISFILITQLLILFGTCISDLCSNEKSENSEEFENLNSRFEETTFYEM
jgi:hypothetical protein